MVIPPNMGVIGFYPSEYYYSRSKMGFYLSLKTNTTSLERDLGELLAQLSAHSGPLSETGATMAAIMEITSEGPQCEEEFFGPSSKEGGPLQPTEFSRLCSTLWLEHFGRRFRRTYDVGAKAQGRRPTVQGPQARHFRCCSCWSVPSRLKDCRGIGQAL